MIHCSNGNSDVRPAAQRGDIRDSPQLVNPRVRSPTTSDLEVVAHAAAKNPGERKGNRPLFTEAKKRAFRRARGRAETAGGTMYRGKWHSATA